MTKLIACFYLPQIGIAVERARLPHLNGEPVGLSGPGDSLVAVSDEVAAFGIRTRQDASGARALCDRLAVIPYDRAAYEEAVHPIWHICAIESSVVEPASPEVCYVGLSGPHASEIAERLHQQIAVIAPCPVHAALAQTKFVASLSARRQEAEYRISRGEAIARQASHPIHTVSGNRFAHTMLHPPASPPLHHSITPSLHSHISREILDKLHQLNVRTFGDLQKISLKELSRRFKEAGIVLYRLARGEDNDPVKPAWPPRSIEKLITFEDETNDTATVHEALLRCAESLGQSIAERNEYCRLLSLRLEFANGKTSQTAEKLAVPLSSSQALHRAALRMLKRMGIEEPLLEVSLRASDLGSGSGVQLALMDKNDRARGLPHERQRSLDSAAKFLRKRFGPEAVLTGAVMRKDRRISLWTYPLGHLMDEPVQVATDSHGLPVRFWRKGRPREIKRIQDSWREAEWTWDGLSERTIYRVETDPPGLCELQLDNTTWRLNALAD